MDELISSANYDELFKLLAAQLVDMTDMIIWLIITAVTLLVFTLGYRCIGKNSKEGALLSKLNVLERKLMTSWKECDLMKTELLDTRGKLTSIEDNSFGSNEMVIALKQQLDNSEQSRLEMMDQIASLEKELENAAEAGLELNKMVSELLSNQSGSDSIISSVEELQKQLNEQQGTAIAF